MSCGAVQRVAAPTPELPSSPTHAPGPQTCLPHPTPPAPRLQVQLLLGRLPSPALIAAHGLQQYEPIIAAMRSGDVKLFNDTMDAQQFRFIQEVRDWGGWAAVCFCGLAEGGLVWAGLWALRRCPFSSGSSSGWQQPWQQPNKPPPSPTHPSPQGTYLLLEKLRYAPYRRLLRKVHAVHAELEPEKRTQIPLPQFQTALAMQVGGCCNG